MRVQSYQLVGRLHLGVEEHQECQDRPHDDTGAE